MEIIERNDWVNIYANLTMRCPMHTAALNIVGADLARETPAVEASVIVLSTAELAECTCPDWCERDHDRD
jgi:hypothetical protein